MPDVGLTSTPLIPSPCIVTPFGTVKGNASWYVPGYMKMYVPSVATLNAFEIVA